MRKVFLDNLPKNKRGDKEIIDWKNSIGCFIEFQYDNIKSNFKIINYDGRKLTLLYKNELKIIDRSVLMDGRLGGILDNNEKIIVLENGCLDVSELPRAMSMFKWSQCIGKNVKFKIEDKEGNLKILEYDKDKQTLLVLYQNEKHPIRTQSLLSGAFSEIFGTKTSKYQYDVGFVIKNVELLKQIRVKNGKLKPRKGYEYKCLNCGCIGETAEDKLKVESRGICPVCCVPCKKVVKGVNDIATTNPEMIKFFKNKEDIYKYSYASNKKIELKCPDCGAYKTMQISHLYIYGFSCPRCSDGVSYGEKFMFSMLTQLNLDFEIEKSFKWSERKRYDFYIPSLKCIIETHGSQHYKHTGRGRPLEEEQENDKIKKEMAIKNKIINYIVIDTSSSDMKIISDNILKSELNFMLNLNKIDWLECNNFTLSSRLRKVCEYWNDGVHNTLKISEITKLNRGVVIQYLKKGSKAGLCNYNPNQAMKDARENFKGVGHKKVICLQTKEIFKSISEANRQYGTSRVSECCRGRAKSAGKHLETGEKLIWMYCDEYILLSKSS